MENQVNNSLNQSKVGSETDQNEYYYDHKYGRQRRYRARLNGENIPKLKKGISKGYKFAKSQKGITQYRGTIHHTWKGDKATSSTGNQRAIKMYPLQPCEICGSQKTERHHKDGNTLNNNPQNIRFLCHRCHMTEDGRLDRLHKIRSGDLPIYKAKLSTAKSGFKGVYWNKLSKKWDARISIKNKGKYLGSFDTAKDASRAYWTAVKRYFKCPNGSWANWLKTNAAKTDIATVPN